MLPLSYLAKRNGYPEGIRERILTETEKEIPVTVSAGVSHGLISDNVGREVEDLIRRADSYLLEAKTAGKNRIIQG